MDKLLLGAGRIVGVAGIALCAVAVGVRLTGTFWLAGMPVATLLQGGMAATIAGSFCLLAAIAGRAR